MKPLPKYIDLGVNRDRSKQFTNKMRELITPKLTALHKIKQAQRESKREDKKGRNQTP